MESRRYMTTIGVVRCFLLFYLFTFLPFSVVAQQQGCRRGTPRAFTRGAAEGRIPGGDFYKGDLHQLVVLAAFADQSFVGDESLTMEQWDKIFNTKDFSEAPYFGSVRDYFVAQSYDAFSPVFDLQYVVVDSLKKYRSTVIDDENSQFLVEDIVDSLLKRDIEWGLYDWNGDGYVNQLLIIYAGKGSSYGGFGGGYDAIWPHQWWMSEHFDFEEQQYRQPCVVTDSEGHTYLVDCYCAVQELASRETWSTFGTLCHEYSHCFGFPDFYYGSTKNVGNWDLMDYGNYNGKGFQPCGYSAHERWLMDWLTPEELFEAATVTDLPSLSDEGRAYLLRNDGCESEYYIIENRQQRGWDELLPGSGVVVFHVDYDPSIWTSVTQWPNDNNKKHYTIFHANNTGDETGWAYPYGGHSNLTNTSVPAATLNNPNVDGTMLMSKPITNMVVNGGIASFEVMADPTAVTAPTFNVQRSPRGSVALQSTFNVLSRIGPVTIVRDESGTVRKVISAPCP